MYEMKFVVEAANLGKDFGVEREARTLSVEQLRCCYSRLGGSLITEVSGVNRLYNQAAEGAES